MIMNIQVNPNGRATGEGRTLSMYLLLNANEKVRPYEKIYVRAKLRVVNQLIFSVFWGTIEKQSKQIIYIGHVSFVNWMRIPDAASARSNWMQQSDVVRSRFWKFWIMHLEIVSGCSYVRFTFLYFVSG